MTLLSKSCCNLFRTLKYINEKKLLVGKIAFSNNNTNVNVPTTTSQTVPVYLSENSLKLLNKTFLN